MEWRMGNIIAKKMWIAGEWCDSEDGATADVIDTSGDDSNNAQSNSRRC